jgi:hypothetical protein
VEQFGLCVEGVKIVYGVDDCTCGVVALGL